MSKMSESALACPFCGAPDSNCGCTRDFGQDGPNREERQAFLQFLLDFNMENAARAPITVDDDPALAVAAPSPPAASPPSTSGAPAPPPSSTRLTPLTAADARQRPPMLPPRTQPAAVPPAPPLNDTWDEPEPDDIWDAPWETEAPQAPAATPPSPSEKPAHGLFRRRH